jgi:phenylalanyl-tRNA synthetase alpha chain
MTDLPEILKTGLDESSAASSLSTLEEIRVKYLGKSGLVTSQMKIIATLPAEEKKAFGAEINRVKDLISAQLDEKKSQLEASELIVKLASESIDITLPIRQQRCGSIHPISQVTDEVIAILGGMGFAVEEGPEIEDDFHNFGALNIHDNHPARQMQDTFYLEGQSEGKPLLLRTHTSSVQIRTMQKLMQNGGHPPFKFVAPGRVYRSDMDMTHTPMFHQIEGLYIDKNVNMGHLKGVLHEFLNAFFEIDAVPIRFRPSFFPFTEPSAEVDIGCARSRDGVKIGAGDDWLEILGCGMVHPNVLKNVGINPDEYQGFAFGIGLERLAMLKYGAPDLREFFDADARWLEHYGF